MKTLIAILFLISTSAMAEDALTLKEAVTKDPKLKEGWTKKMSVSANIGLNTSDNVVGQANGNTEKYEGKLDAGFYHKEGLNEWRQDVKYSGATTKTPTIPKFVKSADEFSYETIYLKGLKSHPNVGPYGKISLSTALFKGVDVREEAKLYQNITTATSLGTKTEQPLTDAFKPLTLKQSVGFFAKMIERENTYLELRLGVGAQQVYAEDQLILKDDEATAATIEVQQLDDFSQVGLEYGLMFKGKWNESSEYSLAANFLSPVGKEIEAGKECADCSDMELTNVDLTFSVGTQLNSWSKLSYQYKALKQPELLDKFQVQNGLVLTVIYSIL